MTTPTPFKILNPYENAFDGDWFKGDLHIHTDASDGRQTREQVLHRLREEGFAFAAISDHDVFTPGDDASAPVLVGGCEFNTSEGDVLGLFAQAQRPEGAGVQTMVDAVRAAGGLPVLPHPKIGEFRPEKAGRALTAAKLLRELSGFAGMEVYTHNIGSGFQLAADRLDVLWTSRCGGAKPVGAGGANVWAVREPPLQPTRPWAHGEDDGRGGSRTAPTTDAPMRVWGFATSDSHDPHTISGDVGIMVAAKRCDAAALREAIEAGRFYSLAASPARFREISVQDGVLRVVAEGAQMVQLYGKPQPAFTGERRRLDIAWADGAPAAELEYRIQGTEGFIRAEAMDRQGNLILANPVEVI